MAFWTDASFEPKRDFRWKVDFGSGISNTFYPEGIPAFYATKVDKPNFKIATKEYKILNKNHYFPGNVTWDPIEMEFVDDVDSSTSEFLNTYFFLVGMQYDESNKDGMNYIDTVDKTDALQIQISHLNSDGDVVEKWILDNANVIEFKQSTLDYESDKLTKYTIRIVYDWAYLDGVNYVDELLESLPQTNVAKSLPLIKTPNFQTETE